MVGVTAQVVFTAGWVVTELWQGPRYSPVNDTISDMQARTAPHVWFPIAAFALAAIATFAFAVFGLRPALAGAGKRASFAPWMLAFSALALGNSFPLIPCRLSDPGCTPSFQLNSPGGLTDAIVSGLAFFVLVITPFPLWRRLATLPGWQRLRPILLAATCNRADLVRASCHLLERSVDARARAHRTRFGGDLHSVDRRAGGEPDPRVSPKAP